ncbi:MAG TPA: methyltransferase domain-containing protein, partial [Frankiaceae bacterium]|nr:methyltransferase domain-containing protein [Frankiaceae bacterium]
ILARLGHRVTAADLSPGMIGRLRAKAAAARLPVEVVETAADTPPPGPLDAVVERHLVWTLPDPREALSTWRGVAPGGRLVLLESLWGSAADLPERLRVRGRRTLHRLRRDPPAHHDEYDPAVQAGLPLGTGTPPGELVELAEAAGWSAVRLRRLRDVEWAARCGLPPLDRLFGVTPRFAVAADDR